MMQCAKIVTKALEKEDTQHQRELIIGTAAISAYASRLMHLKMKSPAKKDYKIYTNTHFSHPLSTN